MGNGPGLASPTRNAGDLLAEFKATGRQEAFEEIVRRYAAMVFGVCLKTTRNAHDAEDATQAVFLTLAVQCKTERGEILYVGPWLQKVARRISLDLRRSKKRREVRETNHATASGNGNGHHNGNGHGGYDENGSAGIDVEELKVVLNEELNQLPAKYRLPMILHYYGGLTREQIAAELGCKPSTLGVRIHRGRQMLAKRLTLRGASPVAMGMSLAVGLSLAVKAAVSDGMVASTSHAAAKLMAGEELGAMISSHVLSVAHGAAGAAMIAKLKLVAAVVLAAVVLGAGAGATAKVLPLDQLKFQLPFTFDGSFKLPTFRSPFRVPRASAAGQSGVLASATRSVAMAPPVRTVMWMAQDDLVARSGGRVPSRDGRSVAVRSAPGVGATGRLLARVVSTLVASTVRNPGSSNEIAAGAAAPAASPAPPPAPAPAAAQLSRTEVAAAVPAPAPRQTASADKGSSPPAFSVQGNVSFSPTGSVYPLRTPTGAGGNEGSTSTSSAPAPLPLPPRTQVAVAGPMMTVGGPAGSSGRVTISGGHFEAAVQVIGGRGHGEVRQTGGTNVAGEIRLGVEPGSYGEYALEGGELIFKPVRTPQGGTPRATGLQVGDRGTGVFLLGDAKGTGQIDTRWTDPGGSLVVRGDPSGVGIFRGWGRVSMGGFFDLNGQAIADGYGTDRTLEFAGFRYVGNSIDNPPAGGAAGWYARNHGKLTLPDFRVKAGTGAYTWGEDPTDPTLDLVNSARLTLHDVAKAGVMRIALLSKDNGEVPTLPKGHTFIGVWQFDATNLQYGDVDMVVRYDDGLAHELHLNENILKLWRYDDGQWIRMDHDATFWRDPAQHLLGVTAPGGFEFFAVSAPEPGTLGLVLCGAAAALLRRPRRRVAN